MVKATIIADTREKEGFVWHFNKTEWCGGVVREKLETGDYAIKGLENVCLIDRKASITELATNLFDERFHRELERLDSVAFPIIVCEFPFSHLTNYPNVLTIPKYLQGRIRLRGPALLAKLTSINMAHPKIHWHFAGSDEAARQYAQSLLKRVWESHIDGVQKTA